MITIYTEADLANAGLDPKLRALMAAHFDHATRQGLIDMTVACVIQPGDNEAAIINAIGFSPLDGPAAWVNDHGGWFEAVYIVEGTGFAYLVYVGQAAGVWPALIHHCRTQVARSPQ